MDLIVIGGGPSGLRAAEVAALQGIKVRLFDSKPSVGRKFLVAGKGGLNLTHSDSIEQFSKRYSGDFSDSFWRTLLSDFDNTALRSWAAELGVETFVGTSGRVFPREFKAAPLLRRWVERLRSLGVCFEMNQKLMNISKGDDQFNLEFTSSAQTTHIASKVVILALGGASWPETGSTGEWRSLLQQKGIAVAPLLPANCGWEVNWHPDILAEAEGLPLKNITVTAGEKTVPGELLITRYGFEGGALYQLGSTLRSMKESSLTLDLKPSFSAEELADKLQQSSNNIFDSAIKNLRLSKAAASLLKHYSPMESHINPFALARATKALRIPLTTPRPISEAISSAGGIAFSELDDSLMIKRLPGLFVAGEMIDWEAPTGGYLLQGCFATGTRAGFEAANFLKNF